MGGTAFQNAHSPGHPPLSTRRMSPEDYARLKAIYIERLTSYFGPATVACLIEAPEKPSHGDIDMEITTTSLIDWADVASAVGAIAWLERGSNKQQKCSLAVRLDGRRSEGSPPMYTPSHELGGNGRKRKLSPVRADGDGDEGFAQIDLERIPPELKDWRAWHGSYGDLAGILGNLVTVHGFTLSDRDLRVRFEESDACKWDDKWSHLKLPLEQGRTHLSSDPVQVMRFLGLDVARYRDGFGTLEGMFEWLACCRMITDSFTRRDTGTARDRQKLNRSAFNQFFDKWLPDRLEAQAAARRPSMNDTSSDTRTDSPVTRSREAEQQDDKSGEDPAPASPDDNKPDTESTPRNLHLRRRFLSEALDHFHKHAAYNAQHTLFLHHRAVEQVSHLFRALLTTATPPPNPRKLPEILRAFRRNVAYASGRGPYILDERRTDEASLLGTFLAEDGRGLRDEVEVGMWVRENRDKVKGVERERVRGEKGGEVQKAKEGEVLKEGEMLKEG